MGHHLLPKLWARQKIAVFFLLARISFLSISTLHCLAAVTKLLFHLPRPLQPLTHQGAGNFRNTHGRNCPIMVTVHQKRLTPKDVTVTKRWRGSVKEARFSLWDPINKSKKKKRSAFSASVWTLFVVEHFSKERLRDPGCLLGGVRDSKGIQPTALWFSFSAS